MTLILSGTDGLSDVDGSAATPAIRGTDTNTGIFFPAADTIAFSEGGTEAMRIDSSGNVGVGVTPSAWEAATAIQVVNGYAYTKYGMSRNTYYDGTNYRYITTAAASTYEQSGGVHSWRTAASGTAGNTVSFTEAMRIDSSGNLLVGTTSTFSNAGIALQYSGTTNKPIAVWGYGGVDGTYVDWLVSAPYSSNSNERNIIRSSISSGASNSGLQFMISDGGGASTQTQSFRINRTSCTVIGSLSKGSGSFKIDHPLPALEQTHHLVHSFIEGPQADLIYRGKVNLVAGRAEVNIDLASGMTDGTFVALCREVQCFTTNESDWIHVRGSVSGNMLTIEAQDPSATSLISWMVIGERQDKHMMETEWTDGNGKVIVEPLKPVEPQPENTEGAK